MLNSSNNQLMGKKDRQYMRIARIDRFLKPFFFFLALTHSIWGFPDGSVGKESACSMGHAGEAGSVPGTGRSPGGGRGNRSSILAWRISLTEEPGGLLSWT